MHKIIFFDKTKYKLNLEVKKMDIQKHLSITGSSSISWNDAITKAIEEASKSIDFLTYVEVLRKYATISGNKIEEYLVDLDLSFTIDPSRK